MFARFSALVSPGGMVAIALCLAFPFAWKACFPALDGEAVTVRLTRPRPADVIDVPADARRARRVDFKARENEQLLAYAVEVPRAATYSVYGISANRRAQPLELHVNGVGVSANAFYQKTGGMRAGFERHLIARGVRFRAGENLVTLSGTRAMYRTLLLELRLEAPLGPFRYTVLGAVAALILLARRILIVRIRLASRSRLAIASGLFVAGLAAFPLICLRISDGQLIPLGYQDPIKTERLRLLELRLRSEDHRRASADRFDVFVMGDSTHYWSLPPEHHLVAAMRRALPEESRDRVEIYGLAGGALNAFDFYLLLNRIVREHPDLVVIPLSLRSFSDRWLYNTGYRFHGMDHYLSTSEFLRSRRLSVAGREIPLVGWLLRKADAACCNGDAEHLLRGIRTFFQAEQGRVERRIDSVAFASWTPIPPEAQLATMPWRPEWNTHIPRDHPLFEAFRLIDRLAAENGIEILYYTEQINVAAQREKGNDVRIVENFATLEREITGGPGIRYLMLSDRNPREIFSDDVDHLTANGMAALAESLVREILEIQRERAEGASPPGE